MRQLDDQFFVSGQVRPEQLADLAARGFAAIVSNRPDGEEPGQPASAELEAAAETVGLGWRHIPVAGGFSDAQVAAMADALEGPGPILAFCRSGTRSAFLWALAEARRGKEAEALIASAAAAGYDLSPIRAWLA